jgi:hypothetical protein
VTPIIRVEFCFRTALVLAAVSIAACRGSTPSPKEDAAPPQQAQREVRIDPSDTAAYSSFGQAVVAAVARCKPPACHPYISSGPGRGELLVALDSAAKPGEQMQWHRMPDEPPPGGQAFQDSAWTAYLSQWDTASKPPIVLVDGVHRTFAWARANVRQPQVWGFQQVPPAEARKLSHDPGAANGALVITTKEHAPPQP